MALIKSAAHQNSNGAFRTEARWLGLFPSLRIEGGPFRQKPLGHFGVCLLEQVPRGLAADVHFPIEDFQTPRQSKKVVDKALKTIFRALLRGETVYVGCAGGWGRTGTFLALIAKALGEPNPVLAVRHAYGPHAVETQAQAQYVHDYDVTELRRWLRWAVVARLFRRRVSSAVRGIPADAHI